MKEKKNLSKKAASLGYFDNIFVCFVFVIANADYRAHVEKLPGRTRAKQGDPPPTRIIVRPWMCPKCSQRAPQ